jgi:aspartate/methionine/tyrosine aminotransferase
MFQLAAEYGAINLSQGFPDFQTPSDLLDRVVEHLREAIVFDPAFDSYEPAIILAGGRAVPCTFR